MAGDFVIEGANQFGALAKRLKDAGDKELKKELYSAISRAAKPVAADVKANVPNYMPKGYQATLSGSLRISTTKRASARDPGITIRARAKGKSEPRYVGPLDNGELRHPVYGNRNVWRVTTVKPGFFTAEVQKHADNVRNEISTAMQLVAEKAAH